MFLNGIYVSFSGLQERLKNEPMQCLKHTHQTQYNLPANCPGAPRGAVGSAFWGISEDYRCSVNGLECMFSGV